MKLVTMFNVLWKPDEPNYSNFAGLGKSFNTLQEAFDYIESEESPSDMIPVSKDQSIDITYIYTKETEVGHEEHSVTKSLQEWKKSQKLSI